MFHEHLIVTNRAEEQQLIRSCYPTAARETLDTLLLEGEKMDVCECGFGWSDVGSWPVMSHVLPHTADGNATVITPKEGQNCVDLSEKPKVIFQNTKDTIVSVPDGVAAIVRGLDGYLVAMKDNVLIITPNDDPARMRHLSTELQVKYGEEFL